jgi:hypothetical protein
MCGGDSIRTNESGMRNTATFGKNSETFQQIMPKVAEFYDETLTKIRYDQANKNQLKRPVKYAVNKLYKIEDPNEDVILKIESEQFDLGESNPIHIAGPILQQ